MCNSKLHDSYPLISSRHIIGLSTKKQPLLLWTGSNFIKQNASLYVKNHGVRDGVGKFLFNRSLAILYSLGF